MTFLTDLDNLIRHHHGDVKKLREIRNTIRHDNFITTEDKEYIQALINEHLNGQQLDKSSDSRKPDTRIKLETKSKSRDSDSQINFANFSSNKKMGILGGAAAAIAIIAVLGFTSISQDGTTESIVSSTANNPILVAVDQSKYQRADIISISGDTTISGAEPVTLSIINVNGAKIWNEEIIPKNNGNFSTLIIAGGGGWENNGAYTLKVMQKDLANEIKFQIVA